MWIHRIPPRTRNKLDLRGNRGGQQQRRSNHPSICQNVTFPLARSRTERERDRQTESDNLPLSSRVLRRPRSGSVGPCVCMGAHAHTPSLPPGRRTETIQWGGVCITENDYLWPTCLPACPELTAGSKPHRWGLLAKKTSRFWESCNADKVQFYRSCILG